MGIFREESISRVNGIGIGDLGGTDNSVDLEIAFRAVGGSDADGLIGKLDVQAVNIRLGVDGNGLDA